MSKYFWLRLHKDFFKRHDIRIVEDMPNGKDYILFYLKLLAESVDHEGELRFSNLVPYSDTMLATLTNTNVDIVRSAMNVFIELGMIEMLEDKTIFMAQVEHMIGSCAELDPIQRENHRLRQQRYRKKKKLESIELLKTVEDTALRDGNVTVTRDVEIEKEKELEKDIDNISPAVAEIVAYLNKKCGTKFQASTPQTRHLIKARMKEHFTVDDFKAVIDKKSAEWLKDAKMRQYLRPATLFGTKFEGYLNQQDVKSKNFENERDYDFDSLEKLITGGS